MSTGMEEYQAVFAGKSLERLQEILTRYPTKQAMEGVKAPVGEAYAGIENPKGELGNYFVSDGTAKPVRWRIRPPAFINLAAISKMAEGHLLSDLIAINASVDIVMGEVDR